MILSIDPGTKYHGLAYFKRGRLEFARLVERKNLVAWVNQNEWLCPKELYVEQPHKQQRTVNVNVLMNLACAAGEAAGIIIAKVPTVKVTYLWASTWKGITPKDVSHDRIRAELGADEINRIIMPRAVKTLGHNVMDAVGIGLHAVGRLERGKARRAS